MQKNIFLYLILSVALTGAIVFTLHLTGRFSSTSYDDLMKQGLTAYEQKNYKKAVSVFEKAMTFENAEAPFVLGSLYINGLGVDKDVNKALSLYQLSAEKNYSPAQYTLALFYMAGSFVEKDVEKAEFYIKKAAENGDKEAMSTLASWYDRGAFGTIDKENAVSWYKKAAFLGDVNAQTALALIFTQRRDMKQADYWNGILQKRQNFIDRFSGRQKQNEKEMFFSLVP